MCFKLIKHEQWKKEKHWKQPANELEPCTGALYERFWKMKKHGNVGTDYFVQRWIPYGWNESMEWIQEAGQTKKHVGQSATSRRKRHGQPRGTERQMMCDRGPLIDRHLTPEGKEHGQPRQANHRISQKNTENTEIYDFRIFRANSSLFTSICLFEI